MTTLENTRNVLLKETRERLPPLREIEKQRLLKTTRKVDETRKYWVDVQQGIVSSHGERDPL